MVDNMGQGADLSNGNKNQINSGHFLKEEEKKEILAEAYSFLGEEIAKYLQNDKFSIEELLISVGFTYDENHIEGVEGEINDGDSVEVGYSITKKGIKKLQEARAIIDFYLLLKSIAESDFSINRDLDRSINNFNHERSKTSILKIKKRDDLSKLLEQVGGIKEYIEHNLSEAELKQKDYFLEIILKIKKGIEQEIRNKNTFDEKMKIVREVFRNYNIFSIKVVSEDAFKEELNEAREMSRNRALPAKFEKIIDDPKALSIQIQRVASSLHEVLGKKGEEYEEEKDDLGEYEKEKNKNIKKWMLYYFLLFSAIFGLSIGGSYFWDEIKEDRYEENSRRDGLRAKGIRDGLTARGISNPEDMGKFVKSSPEYNELILKNQKTFEGIINTLYGVFESSTINVHDLLKSVRSTFPDYLESYKLEVKNLGKINLGVISESKLEFIIYFNGDKYIINQEVDKKYFDAYSKEVKQRELEVKKVITNNLEGFFGSLYKKNEGKTNKIEDLIGLFAESLEKPDIKKEYQKNQLKPYAISVFSLVDAYENGMKLKITYDGKEYLIDQKIDKKYYDYVLHLRDENKVFLGNAVKNASANATNLEEMFKNLQFLLKDQNRMKILAFSKNGIQILVQDSFGTITYLYYPQDYRLKRVKSFHEIIREKGAEVAFSEKLNDLVAKHEPSTDYLYELEYRVSSGFHRVLGTKDFKFLISGTNKKGFLKIRVKYFQEEYIIEAKVDDKYYNNTMALRERQKAMIPTIVNKARDGAQNIEEMRVLLNAYMKEDKSLRIRNWGYSCNKWQVRITINDDYTGPEGIEHVFKPGEDYKSF